MKNTELLLGHLCHDTITGFKGIATEICEFINGCRQYWVEPKVNEKNEKQEGHWIDEAQLESLGDLFSGRELTAFPIIPLGARCKDTITDLVGMCIGRTTTLSNEIFIGIKPKVGEDNKMIQATYVAQYHVISLEQEKDAKDVADELEPPSKRRGGPQADAPRH